MHRPTRLLALAGAVLASLALAACGGGGDDDSQVKDRVNGLYDALADKKADKACESLSDDAKDQLTKGSQALSKGKKQSCEDVMGLVFAFAGKQIEKVRDVKVTNVKVDGDKATATVEQGKTKNTVPLVKEDGEWLISSLSTGQAPN